MKTIRTLIKERIKKLELELEPLSEEYDREYKAWMNDFKDERRSKILHEYEEGGKGLRLFSLQQRILELRMFL